MAAPTLYPGVYVTEIPSGIRPITGVATSITAFLGRALKGPVNTPVTVNGFADYQRIFGGLWMHSTVSFAVSDFYANGGGQALVVRLASSDATSSTIAAGGLELEAAGPGAWSAGLSVAITPGSTDPDVAKRYGVQPSDLFNLTVTDTSGDSETFPNLTVLAQGRNVQHVLQEDSVLLAVAGPLPTTTPAPGTYTVGTAGTDGGPLSDNDYIGGTLQAQHQGLWALDEADLFNLLCIPPPTWDETDQTSPSVYSAALNYCVTRRAMLLVDPPPGLTTSNAIAQLGTLGLTGIAARNAALYFPRLREPDPTSENRLRTFVPCGAIAGVMARTDAARGVWKAPAGIDATLTGVQRPDRQPDRRRERRAQPARHQLPAHLPGRRPGGLGRADPARRRRARRRVQVRAGPAAGAVPRGEPLPGHPVGGVRAERRAAVGADPPEHRRVHARPVPPGRVPGQHARRTPTSSSATRRPRRQNDIEPRASSTSWSASRRSSRPSS